MGLLDSVFSKRKDAELDPDILRSRVIYNTEENFIVLLQFGSNHFFSMVEFVSQMPKELSPKVIVANSSTEKELTKEEQEDFDKKLVKLVDHRYYALVIGPTATYANIFNYVDLSNPFMEEITKDIYQYCDSSIFNDLINYGVLTLDKFRYQYIKPKYDARNMIPPFKFIKYSSHETGNAGGYFDDYIRIISEIPKCFSAIDVVKHIWISPDCLDTSILYEDLIKNALDGSHPEVEIVEALKYRLNNFIIPNATLEQLSILTVPIFMREDIPDEDEITGSLSNDEIDDIFKQDYTRFNRPTAEYLKEYTDIDEQLSSERIEDETEENASETV